MKNPKQTLSNRTKKIIHLDTSTYRTLTVKAHVQVIYLRSLL